MHFVENIRGMWREFSTRFLYSQRTLRCKLDKPPGFLISSKMPDGILEILHPVTFLSFLLLSRTFRLWFMLDIIQKQLHRFLLPHNKIFFNSSFLTALIYLYFSHIKNMVFFFLYSSRNLKITVKRLKMCTSHTQTVMDVWKISCKFYCLLYLLACIPASRCFLRVILGVTRFILIFQLRRFIILNAFFHFPDNSILAKVEVENISKWILSRTEQMLDPTYENFRDSTPFDTWYLSECLKDVLKLFTMEFIYNIFFIFLIKVYIFILLCSHIIFALCRYVQLKE